MSDAIKQKKLGMLALAAFLIVVGVSGFVALPTIIVSILAIAAGVLIVLDM